MDYNTKREKLIMPEYGREIQQMVEHCKTLANRDERLRCAKSIIATMERMTEEIADKDELRKKLWNHLATISNYELDIDYPVAIERMDSESAHPDTLPYPQQKMKRRNYGVIVEKFAGHLAAMDQGSDKENLTLLVANQMKRDLANWSVDSLSDEKVADDLAEYTEGKVQLDLGKTRLVSDGELLSSRISTSVKKKKRK